MPRKSSEKRKSKANAVMFGEVFDRKFLEKYASDAQWLLEYMRENKPLAPKEIYQGIPEKEIEAITNKVIKRIPFYCKTAKRRLPTKSEIQDIKSELAAFLRQQSTSPVIDSHLIQRSTEFAGLRLQPLNGNFFVMYKGLPDLIILASGPGTTGVLEEVTEEKKSLFQSVAFAIDITLEVFGFILGLIGISIPLAKIKESKVTEVVGDLLKKEKFKRALKKLIDGLRQRDPKSVVDFLEALEELGNVAELFAHIFAGLKWYDYLLTFGKMLAWIAAAISSAGAALFLKILSAFVDAVSLFLKLQHADEYIQE